MTRCRFLAPLLLILACACAPTMKVSHVELWTLRDRALEGGDADVAAFYAATPGYRLRIDAWAVNHAILRCFGENERVLPDGSIFHELIVCSDPYSAADCVTLWIDEDQELVARCTFTETRRRKTTTRSGYFRCGDLEDDLSCSSWTYLGRRRPAKTTWAAES